MLTKIALSAALVLGAASMASAASSSQMNRTAGDFEGPVDAQTQMQPRGAAAFASTEMPRMTQTRVAQDPTWYPRSSSADY